MTQETRLLLDEVQGLINQALLGSNRFGEILDLLGQSNHGVLIAVNATVEGVEAPGERQHEQAIPGCVPGQLKLSSDDQDFLRAMKIDTWAQA